MLARLSYRIMANGTSKSGANSFILSRLGLTCASLSPSDLLKLRNFLISKAPKLIANERQDNRSFIIFVLYFESISIVTFFNLNHYYTILDLLRCTYYKEDFSYKVLRVTSQGNKQSIRYDNR
uniref:Uncharacterized protein n=1 Tax=Glossina brevipalpis TaxID=37001 RepID=A0A1A9W1I9_9MUSC